MGLLQDGKWVDEWYGTKASEGHFVRKSSQFRNWVTQRVMLDLQVQVGLGLKQDVIIYMYRQPAHGRIGH